MDVKLQADFLKTIEENKGIIYKIARSYCKDPDDKQDLIQEILFQLWKSFDKFDSSYKFSTWMYRITLNVSISFYRKETLRRQINQPLPESVLYLKEDNTTLDLNNELDQLHQFIQELKELDRAIIILYLEGNNQQDIGEILGLTVTNVSTKVSRIKELLKQKFLSLKN
ncbi:MAG: sigma-70 family RNA polymerase sigma factor [Flammeovirgaceae bacterium]|jgi:RNA polymerase sigma factor (sigma-70 family)|nr:sigma-70 family RNA polymerase sigma factor [Flammeovirgaceae bacterium]MBP9116437.1 sigma-70 family RNA polymerase sigma factor [Acidimicrobiia bacterium]